MRRKPCASRRACSWSAVKYATSSRDTWRGGRRWRLQRRHMCMRVQDTGRHRAAQAGAARRVANALLRARDGTAAASVVHACVLPRAGSGAHVWVRAAAPLRRPRRTESAPEARRQRCVRVRAGTEGQTAQGTWARAQRQRCCAERNSCSARVQQAHKLMVTSGYSLRDHHGGTAAGGGKQQRARSRCASVKAGVPCSHV